MSHHHQSYRKEQAQTQTLESSTGPNAAWCKQAYMLHLIILGQASHKPHTRCDSIFSVTAAQSRARKGGGGRGHAGSFREISLSFLCVCFLSFPTKKYKHKLLTYDMKALTAEPPVSFLQACLIRRHLSPVRWEAVCHA